MATAKQTPAKRAPEKHSAATRITSTPLPNTRAELLVLHDAARRRRDAAPLDSRERVEAAYEIERIEVQVARIERAMDPPLV